MFEKEPLAGHALLFGLLVGVVSYLVFRSDFIGGNYLNNRAAICIPINIIFAIMGSNLGFQRGKSIRSKWQGLILGGVLGAILGNICPSIFYVFLGGQ